VTTEETITTQLLQSLFQQTLKCHLNPTKHNSFVACWHSWNKCAAPKLHVTWWDLHKQHHVTQRFGKLYYDMIR